MKRLSSLLATFFAILVTIGAASRVGLACATSIYGMNEDGDHVHCSYTGQNRYYCFYNCVCHNDHGGGDCSDIYDELGLEAY